jgi:hypothetical protein
LLPPFGPIAVEPAPANCVRLKQFDDLAIPANFLTDVEVEKTLPNYDVETLSSLSTLFLTVGRCIMRSRQAVYDLSSVTGMPLRLAQP